MAKYLALLLCVVALVALIPAAHAADDSLLFDAPKLDGITIDGNPADWADRGLIVGILKSYEGDVMPMDKFDAGFRLGWDERGLLFLVKVHDTTRHEAEDEEVLWRDDCVELFLASELGTGDYYQVVLAPGRTLARPELRYVLLDYRDAKPEGKEAVKAARSLTGDEYLLEVLLPWSALSDTPKAGDEVGVQVYARNDGPFLARWYPNAGRNNSNEMHGVRLSDKAGPHVLAEGTAGYCNLDRCLQIKMTGVLDLAGEPFELRTGRSTIAKGTFGKEAGRAVATVYPAQPSTLGPDEKLAVFVHGEQVGAVRRAAAGLFARLREFQNCELRPKNRWDFMFEQGVFPEIEWEEPEKVEDLVGKFPLTVRWFDGELNEVTTPKTPGRYAAVIEGTSADGMHVRRAMTFYCRSRDWRPWENEPKVHMEYLPGSPVNKDAWEEQKEEIASYAGDRFIQFLETDPVGAVFMSYLAEMKPLGRKPTKTETPEIVNNDYHLALKRKLLGVENAYPPLNMPRRIEGKPAPVLRAGTPEEAGVKPDAAEKIRTVCREWYAESKEPFAILVARHGVIVIHEAFGEGPEGAITVDTPMDMASLTKMMTGLMFGQFLDQGLIELDDPVGKFLPDFPVEGDKAITFRHCFTHTTGLTGHWEWGGVHNPWLDNVIANGLPYLTPGKLYIYNGMDYDLAGKAMEIVSGKSVIRLMHENLFDPLGVKNTTVYDLACDTQSAVEDIARMGQLLLNKGSYGDLTFFSEEAFDKLLPQQLRKFYPNIEKTWGVGLVWMRKPHPDAGKEGVPKDKTILGRRTLGHGAASSAILRADLDNDLVIAQTRNQAGKEYGPYSNKFLMAIEEGLVNE